MKSSLAVAALLCAPEVFAVALPHIPKLNSRWYHKDELDTNDAVHVKRVGSRDYIHELKPKRGMPHRLNSPLTTPTSTTPAGTGGTGTPSTPLGMLPLPAATIHNPYVGNHPFIGHGPVIRYPTATAAPSGYGEYNFTLTYVATGTTPPIANTTATLYPVPVYVPVINSTTKDTEHTNTTSCDEVPELIDDNGNFLPGDLQPKYNGSSHCTPTNYTLLEVEPEPEKVVIEGHMVGDNEIVEVEVTPMPNVTDSSYGWNNTADDNYGANSTAYPPYDAGTTSTPNALATGINPSSSVHRQRVPTSSTPGFTGPKVRRAATEMSEEEHLERLADLLFD